METGESLEAAARREFNEETGIELLTCDCCCSQTTLTLNKAQRSMSSDYDGCDTNSSCDCTDHRTPVTLTYLEGSGDAITGGKKIHAFVCNGHGGEIYVGSNLIDRGFRKGLPENCAGRYVSIAEALHTGGGVVHKNQRKLIEVYASTYIM